MYVFLMSSSRHQVSLSKKVILPKALLNKIYQHDAICEQTKVKHLKIRLVSAF